MGVGAQFQAVVSLELCVDAAGRYRELLRQGFQMLKLLTVID